jgi:3'(2'), 5'-bisphosphate nucleotidase
VTTTYEQERAVAIEAVRAAARVCRSVQAAITPDVLEKKDRSPVTVADFASQAMVCRALKDRFPSDPIIGEEDASELSTPENAPFRVRVREELRQAGIDASDDDICQWIDHGNADAYARRFWTLDPIDGTKGFLRGEQYAVSLALIVDGQIVVAVLGCPNLSVDSSCEQPAGVILSAVRGGGSCVTRLDGNSADKPIRVSGTSDPAASRFCESVESGHSAHDMSARVSRRLGISAEPARLDSPAKYAVVARGEADIYLRLPANATYREKIWDHAGGVLIVEEAGGMVTDVLGQPLEFTHGRQLEANRGVIATNRLLHEQVLEALRIEYEATPPAKH